MIDRSRTPHDPVIAALSTTSSVGPHIDDGATATHSTGSGDVAIFADIVRT